MAIAFEKIPDEFISKAPIIDYKTPLASILGKLNSERVVILTKNGEYYGIISNSIYLLNGASQGINKKEASYKHAVKVSPLDKETSVANAIKHFSTYDVEAIPYIESNKILGVVRLESILKSILSMKMLSGYKVAEIMSSPIITIDSGTSAAEALSLMRKKKIGRVALQESGKLTGMLSHEELLKYSTGLRQRADVKMGKENKLLPGKAVDIASEIDFIGYNESVDKAIRSFVTKDSHTMIITRSGKPVGILTPKDVLSAAAAENFESEENITISGIDKSTKQYEEDIKSEAEKTLGKVNRFTKFKVLNLSLHVKKHKVRNYEIQVRLWLDKRGALSAYATGYSIEETVKEALERLYSEVKNKKEIVSMSKKGLESQYSEEE